MMSAVANNTFASDSLGSVLMRVRRRWGTFLLVAVVVGGAVMTVKFLLVPQYSAVSAVLIEPDRSPIERHNNTTDSSSADAAEVESQVEMMRSPRLLQAMLRSPEVRADLVRACEFSNRQMSLGRLETYLGKLRKMLGFRIETRSCDFEDNTLAIEAIGKKFTIFQIGRSRVASISFQSSLPETAASVVNALVSEYLQDNIKAKSNARLATANWLEEEGRKLRQSLLERERAIDRYRREHGLLRGQSGLMTQEVLSTTITQLGRAKARVAETTARYNAAQQALQRGENAASNTAVLSSNIIRDQRAAEVALSKEVAQLSSQHGDNFPRMISSRNELRSIRANIAAETDRIMKSLAADMASAAEDERTLQAALDGAKGEAASASDADSAVQSLVRDADIDRQLYFVLASRAKELETETRAQSPNARLVSLAEVPNKPSFPQLVPFLGAATLLGGISGIGAAFMRDYADKTLRDVDLFGDISQIPILARIPQERALTRSSRFLSTISDDRTGFREAIRALHARLLLRGDPQVLLVTSSAPREGKTSLSVALAHFAASAGRRVLLIEADLRMPSFGKLMPLAGAGLEAFLNGTVLDGPVVKIPDSNLMNLHVLPAGRYAQNSTELLSSPRMAQLLNFFRRSYDFIIIDTPPANYLMDACVLARQVDGVLLAARYGQSEPQSMRHAAQAIETAGGRIIGMAVGMVEHTPYSSYGDARASAWKAS